MKDYATYCYHKHILVLQKIMCYKTEHPLKGTKLVSERDIKTELR